MPFKGNYDDRLSSVEGTLKIFQCQSCFDLLLLARELKNESK